MERSRLTVSSVAAILAIGLTTSLVVAADGPLSNATVSFGQWQTGPSAGPPPVLELDRFPNLSPRLRNNHELIPNQVTIKAGGAVNFIIGGFHHPIVYDDGTRPTDIDVNSTITTTGPTPSPAVVLINDPKDRIYRGLDPSLQPLDRSGAFGQDRVEVVHFSRPGTYLVICGVRGHFVTDGMFGFVKVLP